MADDPQRPSLNPAALSLQQAAQLLSRAGGQTITVEQIEADVAAGVPTSPDGTLNLVTYAAWLLKKEMSRGE